jgi:hypothetical protein
VPDGPPLTKLEVVTMLQGGVASARVEQFVEKRGADFQLTPEVAREIAGAGGRDSLVGLITRRGAAAPTPAPAAVTAAAPAAGYDDLIDRAHKASGAQDFAAALRHAQEAAQLDPQQPAAFSLIGALMLYYKQNVPGAEQAMRAAIERGGAAAFHVYHDHDGNFGQYCEGSFLVTKTGISFKANDGRDTFEAEDSNIKEAKVNTWVGAAFGAFHVKPVQKINGRDNSNFAPNTRNKAESQLIIRLIQAY